MAKNWTIAEVVEMYAKGNKEAILDIGKRFPLLADKISRIVAGNADAACELLAVLPEYNTANKINSRLKEGLEESDVEDVEETTEEDEAPAKKPEKKTKKAKKTEDVEDADEDDEDEEPAEVDLSSMSTKKLYNLCKERGIKVKSKQTKEFYIEALNAQDADDSDAEDEADTEETGDEYEGKTAKELFKICKQRGIKAELKKPAKYYAELLRKADAEADEAEAEDEDDDWEDEAPAKSTKKEKKSKASKKTEDEDDDWEI